MAALHFTKSKDSGKKASFELEMARADAFKAQTAHGQKPTSPVTVTDPATHTKNKAQPAHSSFFL